MLIKLVAVCDEIRSWPQMQAGMGQDACSGVRR